MEVENNVENEESLKKKIWNESKKMWIVAASAILIRFSTFGVNVISQVFIGHVSSSELAAYALVFTVLLRFYLGILVHLQSQKPVLLKQKCINLLSLPKCRVAWLMGAGTLCGQAYGAKKYHKLGIYLQQLWIILLVVTSLVSLLFIFAAPLLKALGQDEHIARRAGTLALWFISLIFMFSLLYSCNIYLQSQSKIYVLSCCAVLSLLQHIFLSWLLTMEFKFGVTGVMVSAVVAYVIPNAGQLVYVMFGGCRETWKGFTAACFKDLWLTISSGVMICLEFSYITILILLTGNMGTAQVTIDALTICLNISGWAQMISYGFMAAVSVRVSNELGRKDTKAAKLTVVVTVLTSFTIGLVLFAFLLLFRERVAYVFTKSPAVAKAVARLSPLLAVTMLINGFQPVLSSVANGAGRQGIVAYANLGCYYLIGIPLGIILGYVFKLKVEGVWSGMIIGIVHAEAE